MAKSKELSFSVSSENLKKLIETMKDLSNINSVGLIKIDPKYILIYSLVGEGKSINAFKSYTFKTSDLIQVTDVPDVVNFIIRDTKLFWRNLQTINDFNIPVDCKMSYDEFGDMFLCDVFNVKSNKIKLKFIGGDPLAFNAKVTLKQIKNLTNSENENFNFIFSADDFANVKRLSATDKDNDVFYLSTVNDGDKTNVVISESSWDMVLSETTFEREITMAFPKKYFKTIGGATDSIVHMFDTYLVITNNNSDLLISSEVTV